jgi:acyl-CoA thioester hydrolase
MKPYGILIDFSRDPRRISAMKKKVIVPIPVRFRDIDAMGHVNNAVYFTYFEEGRKAFLREAFGITRPGDYPFILERTACDYLRPIRLDDQVILGVDIAGMGTKSFTFGYVLYDGRDAAVVYGKGESVMVMYDYAKAATVALDAALADVLREYMPIP